MKVFNGFTPHILYILGGVWEAGFFVGGVQQHKAAYFAPLTKLFSTAEGWDGWLANFVLFIPNMSTFVLFLLFSYLAVEGNSRGETMKATAKMIVVHLAFSSVSGLVVAKLPDVVVNFIGPSIGVAGAFLLYLGAEKKKAGGM